MSIIDYISIYDIAASSSSLRRHIVIVYDYAEREEAAIKKLEEKYPEFLEETEGRLVRALACNYPDAMNEGCIELTEEGRQTDDQYAGIYSNHVCSNSRHC